MGSLSRREALGRTQPWYPPELGSSEDFSDVGDLLCEVIAEGAKPKPTNGASSGRLRIGHNGGPALSKVEVREALFGLTRKQIFQRCVWLSEESTHTKIVLLCIARFFDDDAQNSSMSYAQIERDCECDESTAKREVKKAKGRWLRVEPGKGFWRPQGNENLYHGICPPDLVERLHVGKCGSKKGVAGNHPLDEQGEGARAAQGCQENTPAEKQGSQETTGSQEATPGVSGNHPNCVVTLDKKDSPPSPRKRRAKRGREDSFETIIEDLKAAGHPAHVLNAFIAPVSKSLEVRHSSPRRLFEETCKLLAQYPPHFLEIAARQMALDRKVWVSARDLSEPISKALPLAKQWRIRPDMPEHWAAWKAYHLREKGGKGPDWVRYCEAGQGYFFELTEWPPGQGQGQLSAGEVAA
jgi:hypothetical protein